MTALALTQHGLLHRVLSVVADRAEWLFDAPLHMPPVVAAMLVVEMVAHVVHEHVSH